MKGGEEKMGEKLSAKRVSLSLAITSGVFSTACALLIAIAPQFMIKFFGAIFHGIDISQIERTMTLSGAITGIIAAIIVALITGWLFAVIYNKFAK